MIGFGRGRRPASPATEAPVPAPLPKQNVQFVPRQVQAKKPAAVRKVITPRAPSPEPDEVQPSGSTSSAPIKETRVASSNSGAVTGQQTSANVPVAAFRNILEAHDTVATEVATDPAGKITNNTAENACADGMRAQREENVDFVECAVETVGSSSESECMPSAPKAHVNPSIIIAKKSPENADGKSLHAQTEDNAKVAERAINTASSSSASDSIPPAPEVHVDGPPRDITGTQPEKASTEEVPAPVRENAGFLVHAAPGPDSSSSSGSESMPAPSETAVLSPTTSAPADIGNSEISNKVAPTVKNKVVAAPRPASPPQFLYEQPLLDNPYIVNVHAIGEHKTSDGMPTANKPRANIGDFDHQRDNREGVFADKDVLADSKQLPHRLNEYIEVMIKDMKLVELPQQMFVGARSLELFNLWKNRLYKHTIRKSTRTAPRRAQVGDSVVSQVSMRFMLLEIANEHAGKTSGTDAARPRMPEGFLINTFRDNSSWRFRIANVSGNDETGAEADNAAGAQLPWLRRMGDDDNDEDDYDDDVLDKNDEDKSSQTTGRMPVDHQATLQCIVLAASSMQEGEYSRFLVQLPTPFVCGPCRVPPESWLEIELLISKIESIGSLMRVLAAPLPKADDDTTATAQQQVVSFKDLQDAVETDRRECRVLFNSGRWKEALFVCWRLRDHIQRYRIPHVPAAKEDTDDAETLAARAADETGRQQQQLEKDHLLSNVYVNISRCLLKISDFMAACEAAEIALNYKADNTFAMFMCVRTLYRAGLYTQARDKLQHFHRQLPALLADNDDFIKLATDLDKKLQLTVKAEQECYRRMMRDFSEAAGMPIFGENESDKTETANSSVAKTDDVPKIAAEAAVDAAESDADDILKQMSARVDRKFSRQARQILHRFRDNDGSVSAPWPDLLTLTEAQFVKALSMNINEQQTTDNNNKQPAVEAEIEESTMHVGKFLVMLRKKTTAAGSAEAKKYRDLS